jgi:hypothetical protein
LRATYFIKHHIKGINTMTEQWYYAQQGQRIGPVSEEQIRQMMSSGQIQPTDSVWKQGMAQWTQANKIFSSPVPAKHQGMWSRLSTLQRLLGIGGIVVVGVVFLSCFGILGKGSKKHDTAFSEWDAGSKAIDVALSKADQQWEAGNKAEAVDGYLNLISGGSHLFRLSHNRDLPRLYRRVIDYQVEKAGPESARDLIRDALRKNVVLTLSSPEANAIVAEERPAADEEWAKEEARRELQRYGRDTVKGGKDGVESELITNSAGSSSPHTKPGRVSGQATINSDGSYSGSYRSDGFSGKSRMNADGSGEGEYDVNGTKIKVKVQSDGSGSIDMDGNSYTLPKH